MLICGISKRVFLGGNYESVPISAVPAGESGYPDGLMLSPPGIVLLRQDSGCPRRGWRLSGRINAVD